MGEIAPRDGKIALRHRLERNTKKTSLLSREYDALRSLGHAKVRDRDAGQVRRSFARRPRDSASTKIGRVIAVSQYIDSRTYAKTLGKADSEFLTCLFCLVAH